MIVPSTTDTSEWHRPAAARRTRTSPARRSRTSTSSRNDVDVPSHTIPFMTVPCSVSALLDQKLFGSNLFWSRTSARPDDRLDLGVGLQPVAAAVASDTRLLEAAEGGLVV